MNLAEQLKALKGKLNAENDLGGQKDTAKIMELEDQIAELNSQILAEEEKQRVQVQEEKVASITLPYDFSKVFDDERANDIILELLQDMRRQDFAEHNQEVSDLVAAHREELNEEKTKREEIYAQLGNTSRLFTELETAHNNVVSELQQVKLELEDIASKRDAAVVKAEGLELLVSEKDAHISKLRDEIAIGAVAAVNVVEISPTDRLAKLIEESKQAKVKSALDIALENNAPFRGKVLTGGAVAELQTPEVQPFQAVNQTGDTASGLDTSYPYILPAIDPATVEAFRTEEGEVHSESSGLGESNAEAVGESGRTLEEAFKRIEALEVKVSGMHFVM